jgi:hypothetical protein
MSFAEPPFSPPPPVHFRRQMPFARHFLSLDAADAIFFDAAARLPPFHFSPTTLFAFRLFSPDFLLPDAR